MKKVSLLLVLSFCAAVICALYAAPLAGGASSFVVIYDEAGFLAMDAGGSYRLGADISVSSTYGDEDFYGTLEGDGHTVTLGGVPLFYAVSGTLRDITLTGSVGSLSEPIAGDAGAAAIAVLPGAVLSGVEAAVGVYASGGAGGLAGTVILGAREVLFENCIVSGAVVSSGNGGAGGILGYSNGAALRITGCVNRADVTASSYAGGLSGQITSAYAVEISDCYNYGTITASKGIAGGAVGRLISSTSGKTITLRACGSYGNVAGGVYAAGVAGYDSTTDGIIIENSFAAGGDISGRFAAGILAYCANENVKINGCYAAGGTLTSTAGNPTCAMLFSKTTWNSPGVNFTVEKYADCLYSETVNKVAQNTLPDESRLIMAEDIPTGLAAIKMNAVLGEDIYRQTLHSEDADAYPTSSPDSGMVYFGGTSQDGSDVYVNSFVDINLLTGAAVKLNENGGLRFTSYMPPGVYEGCLLAGDDPEQVEIGTLIVPTDYLAERSISEFTMDALRDGGVWEYNFENPEKNTNPLELYYINIRAKNGFVFMEDGGVYINASLVEMKLPSYRRAFSAVSYISFVVDSVRYYTYSEYNEADNSRTIEKVAYSALNDTVDVKDEEQGYIYDIGDGKWSCYGQGAREVLLSFITEYGVSITLDGESIVRILDNSAPSRKYGEELSFEVLYYGNKSVFVSVNGETVTLDAGRRYTLRVFEDINIEVRVGEPG